MTPTLNMFNTSFFTTSIIDGFKRLCACRLDLLPYSSRILCMQVNGEILLISTIVQPMASLYLRSTLTSFSSSTWLSLLEVITERVPLSYKKMYLRCSNNGFSSNWGAYKTKGEIFVWAMGRSKWGTILFTHLKGIQPKHGFLQILVSHMIFFQDL